MKLCIPESTLSQHLVALGKTGAGKSSSLRHIVEHLLAKKKRVCVIDPKGDWWGLKRSADGEREGFPIVAFGDFKEERATDIPLNEHAGKALAELVATGNRPCIVGFRGWMPGKMTRFWIDFASTLFNSNGGELYLVMDEVHNFAPKGKVMDPEAGKCLHWTNRLLSEGRGVGVVCLIASQRPQKVHNDTLTCCETLVALRVIHAADRQAIRDWVDGCGDPAQGKDMLANLAGLPRGEAYVWSPEVGFGPQRVKFPLFETFDSFAPPQLQKKVSERGWGATDLDDVKAKFSTVIEDAKFNDPKALRETIRAREKEIATLTAKVNLRAQLPAERVEIPVLNETTTNLMRAGIAQVGLVRVELVKLTEKVEELWKEFNQVAGNVVKATLPAARAAHGIPHAPRAPIGGAVQALHKVTRPAAPAGDGTLDGAQQAILDVVHMLFVREIKATRESVARWLDIHPNGGRYGSNLAYLRANDYMQDFTLTCKGTGQARQMETGFDACKKPLDGSQCEILDVLNGPSGNHFTRETLAAALNIHPNGGRYGSNLARLRTMGLIPERGDIYLTEAAHR